MAPRKCKSKRTEEDQSVLGLAVERSASDEEVDMVEDDNAYEQSPSRFKSHGTSRVRSVVGRNFMKEDFGFCRGHSPSLEGNKGLEDCPSTSF
jgi:hypothetical protein